MISCGSANAESEVIQAVKCEQKSDNEESEGVAMNHKLESHFTCARIDEIEVIHYELDIKSDSGDDEGRKAKSQKLNIDFRWPETVKTEEFKLPPSVKCDLNLKEEIQDNDESFASRHENKAQWLQCKLCEYKTKHKDTLKSHFTSKHDVNAQWHHCTLCDYKTKLEKYLKAHSVSKHSKNDLKWYKCQLCEYRTKYKNCLKPHFTSKHDDNAPWYQCELCEFKTKNKSYYNVHCSVKHKDKWYHCSLCEYKTKRKAHLKVHLTTKYGYGRLYQCQSCEYKTQYKRNLKAHLIAKHYDTAQ